MDGGFLFAEGQLYEIFLIELNFIYSVIILYKDLSKESGKKRKSRMLL